jgi:hypothetical protein
MLGLNIYKQVKLHIFTISLISENLIPFSLDRYQYLFGFGGTTHAKVLDFATPPPA